MAPRHRALARSHRRVPEIATVDDRTLVRRLGDREREDPPRQVVGSVVHAREAVHERSLRGPSAGPNAPLLIRLVRHPYALKPVPPGKRDGTARVDPIQPREIDRAPLREALRADRDPATLALPDRDLPELPPRPFRRARAAASQTWDQTVPVGVEEQ